MRTIANVEMAKAWDEEGDHWVEHAERYENAGVGHLDALDAAANIQPTDRVIDIGCGTGVTSRRAARAASEGSVLAVDLSAAMLERGRELAEAEGVRGITWLQADAQVHPFDHGASDVAISSCGTMFFADPVAAFANIGAALRPGGRVATVVWQALEHNEWLLAIRGALAMGRDLPAPPAGAPGPFCFADPGYSQEVLGAAGFVDVDLAPSTATMRFGDSVESAWPFISTMGIVRGLTESLTEDDRDTALQQLHDVMAAHDQGDGVTFASAAWVVTATRA